jgi:hypothetical protein
MPKEEIRQIIREELRDLIRAESYTFQKHLQIFNGRNITVGTGVGTKIATEATQKIGLYGTTPTVQQSKINDPSGGGTQDSEARTAINAIIDALETLGITAST